METRQLPGATLLYREGLVLDASRPAVCVIGVFDGVHAGHRALIAVAQREAAMRNLPCVVVTFAPDPADVLTEPRPSSHLLQTADRLWLLSSLQVDAVVCLDFTPALAAMSPRRFARELLYRFFQPISIHVGSNFRFGARGKGTPALLRTLDGQGSYTVCEHDLLRQNGEVVSSTRIRRLLRAGEVASAASLLTRVHMVRGQVQHGRGEGSSFGFPTANVVCDPLDCMPAEGVYAGWVVSGARVYPAAINVGAPRTFSDDKRPSFLEAHLLGFSGDLYDADVAVLFVAWLRAARSFASTAELEQVVLSNIEWVRNKLGQDACNLGERHVLDVARTAAITVVGKGQA